MHDYNSTNFLNDEPDRETRTPTLSFQRFGKTMLYEIIIELSESQSCHKSAKDVLCNAIA